MTNGTEFTGVRDNSAVRNISDDEFEANIRDLIGAQEYHFQVGLKTRLNMQSCQISLIK